MKVTDFGIAKAMELPQQTIAGAIIGTPIYMSPEQVRGQGTDHRVDIYSFGIMLYEMASGRPPFSEGDLSYQHLHMEPAALEDTDPRLAEIIMKCLRKTPDDRWQSFDSIIGQFDRLRMDLGITS